MKKLLACLLLFTGFTTAYAADQTYHVNIITNFNAAQHESFNFSVFGKVRGGAVGGIASHSNVKIALRPWEDHSNIATVQFLYSLDYIPLCNYQVNIVSGTGRFIVNEQYQPKGDDKPITCYAVNTPDNLFLFVRNIK